MYLQDPDSGLVRFTSEGIRHLGPPMARAGYDIRKIRTKAEALAALEACCANDYRKVAEEIRGKNPELDRIMADFPGWEQDA